MQLCVRVSLSLWVILRSAESIVQLLTNATLSRLRAAGQQTLFDGGSRKEDKW